MGFVYDSGNYVATLERALEMVGYTEIGARKAEALQRGKRLGVGIASFTAVCGEDTEHSLTRAIVRARESFR